MVSKGYKRRFLVHVSPCDTSCKKKLGNRKRKQCISLQYPNSPEEFDMDFGLNKNLDSVIDVAKEIKEIGNTFFKEKEFAKALKKYKKALR